MKGLVFFLVLLVMLSAAMVFDETGRFDGLDAEGGSIFSEELDFPGITGVPT